METNREDLIKLLQIIRRVCSISENKWFVDELKKQLYFNSTSSFVAATNEQIKGNINALSNRVRDIERYLALDYKLDVKVSNTQKAKSVINYSWVKDEQVRDKLEADNREMMRFRYGVRSHKIDFEKFCEFAFFQVESLLNYKYSQYPFEEVKRYIEIINEYNYGDKWHGRLYWLKKFDSIYDIDFSHKLEAFCNVYFIVDGISKTNIYKVKHDIFWTFENIRRLRNSILHRGKKKEEHELYINWRNSEDYDKIIKHLQIFAEKIHQSMSDTI